MKQDLWTAPGALVTPHVGGAGSAAGLQRLGARVLDHLRRLCAGEPLQHRLELA